MACSPSRSPFSCSRSAFLLARKTTCWGALAAPWPSYLAYLVSFRLNLLLLLVVSFLPFPTRLLAEYATERDPERVAATVNGINLTNELST